MTRVVEKKALKNSSVKQQAYFFKDQFLLSLSSKLKQDMCSLNFPSRGASFLNFVADLSFGFSSWDKLLHNSLNSDSNTDLDIYLFDDHYFNTKLKENALMIHERYFPEISINFIESALVLAKEAMPKKVTRHPRTSSGRQLCFLVSDNQLVLPVGSHKVNVLNEGQAEVGLLVGFSQLPCRNTGGVGEELARVWIISKKKLALFPVASVSPNSIYDPFRRYRKSVIGDFKDIIKDSQVASGVDLVSDYVCLDDRFKAVREEGYDVFVAIRHPITKQVHDFVFDKDLDLKRLRELYHDTQDLVFFKK